MGRANSPLRDRMVFLVGAQRSGTNWLQRLLAAHPAVVTLPSETHLFTDGMDRLADRFQHGLLTSPSTGTVFMERDDFLDAARDFCDRVFGGVADRLDPAASRIVERSPNHVERLRLIGAIYPDAWILHILRDGRDVARSLLSQPWGPTTVEAAADVWARSVRAARDAAPDLQRYHEVRYEDLLADPATGMRAVFEWLGIAADDGTAARVAAEAGVSFNTDAKRPDIGTGKWVGDWTDADLAAFDRVAGDLVHALGYPAAAAVGARSGRRPRLGPALRRRRVATPAPAPPRPRLPMEARQRSVDAFCAALAAGDGDAAVSSLAPDAVVRIVAAGRDEQGRGEDGRRLLATAVCSDATPWGRQVRGDVHVGATSTTVVLSHERDGVVTDRVIVVGFDSSDRFPSVAVYRLGPGQAS